MRAILTAVRAALRGAALGVAMVQAGLAAAHAGEDAAAFSHSTVRLLNGGAWQAGIEIKLKPGWKTYWRVPGDSGVPPEFDWSGSVNLAGAEVLWPAPVRFKDEFGNNIGYIGEVLFPVTLQPGDPDRPVSLRLVMHYAVCREVCVPARAELEAQVPASRAEPEPARRIARSLARVPRPPAEVPGLAVEAVDAATLGARIGLIVAVRAEEPAPVEVIVEGPSAISFGVPEPLGAEQELRRYFIPVERAASPDRLAGAALTLTILQGEKRLAQPWSLR